jgi:hypothetical protein
MKRITLVLAVARKRNTAGGNRVGALGALIRVD